MMKLFVALRASLLVAVLCALPCVLPSVVDAQEPPEPPRPAVVEKPPAAEEKPAAAVNRQTDALRFSFEGTPWREVIKWLAEESQLALHVQDLPTGSLTYSDPDTFTIDQAIDRVNLFLLSQGYTLVRSGKLLSVINLGDPRSMQQLDALAQLVQSKDLDQFGSHDVVKCIFPLGDIDAADAAEELSSLKLMTTPVVFTKTNRLMVTDTVGKLKSVKAILEAFEPSKLTNGTVMKNFNLQHVDAEDILVVARPHLGLATDETIGIDVSISANLQGDNIFVPGVEDKVKLIEGLINSLDKPQPGIVSGDSGAVLKSYQIEGGNVETVYNVLITLLASEGDSVRLSVDEKSNRVVALAIPKVQEQIAKTVEEVQAANWEFEVIPLKTVDPYFAVTLLEEMLDLPDPLLDDDDERESDPPKIDADPGNMRLYVRGKRHEIDQIKKIVAGLDGPSGETNDDRIRLLPLRGAQGRVILKTAAKFWREDNPIVLFPDVNPQGQQETERVVDGPFSATDQTPRPRNGSVDTAQFLTNDIRSQATVIRCQFTPRGLLVQCDDTKALDRFEDHVRAIAGPGDSATSPPIVFYLKYTKPDDAIRVLAEMLDGGEAALEAEAGSLVNGYVSGSGGSLLGSLVTSRTGTVTLTSGTITVVADSRLNRLIVQGTASDVELVEGYLKVIDKESSITTVETYGVSHLIELRNTKASEVAAVIREAYAGRIVSSKPGGPTAGQPGAPQPGQREGNTSKASVKPSEQSKGSNDKKSSNKQQPAQNKNGSQQVRDLEPKMTIAVHEPSNSLIVTAPIHLFKQVEQLAKLVDARNEQTIRVVSPTNAAVVETLMQVLAEENKSRGGGTNSQPSSLRSPPAFGVSPQGGKNGR